jgi:biotin transport system substrate-specific component
MTEMFTLRYPLHSLCWPKQHKLVKSALLVLIGMAVLAISSQLSIPLKPVPLTFQSATVILIALLYGARLASATIFTYLVAGAAGLPVFANMNSGISILLYDPTSGYLLGFFFAALLTGYLAQNGWGRHFLSAFAAALLGAVVIFALGLIVLAHYTGWSQAFTLGCKPFLLTETIKLLVIAIIAPRCWKSPASK